MKKVFFVSLFLLAGSIFAGTEGNILVSSKGVMLDQGIIRLAGEPVTLFRDDFFGGTKQWPKVVSRKNIIQMKASKGGLKLTNGNPKESDNAWELISADLPLNPEFREYTFTLRARRTGCSVPMYGHGEDCWNRLEWIGRDGKVLKAEPFDFPMPSAKVSETALENSVPEGACAVRIRIGCDTPDLGAKDEILIEQVKLQFFAGKGKIKTEGLAESTPLFVQSGEFLEWKGETPPGTEILFQLSFAEDEHGFPGLWSPFRGPDQDEKEWYVSEGKKYYWFGRDRARLYPEITKNCWVRWRAKLIPNPRMNTAPSLEQVVIGDELSEAWTEKADRQSPFVRFICRTPSENPRMPFAFVVTDNTAVDWKSVKVTVDGTDITKRMDRQKNILTYMPEKPWTMGIHTAAVTLKDINGQQISSLSFFCRGSCRTKKVVIRQDGGVKVDGESFFPIGVYAVAKQSFNQFSFDKAMQDLKKTGVNMVHTDERDGNFRDFLEAAAKNRMKIFISCGSGANGKELRPMLETIRKEQSNDSILAWYIGNKTSMYFSPAEMKQRGEAVRNIDPARLTVQSDAVCSGKPRSNYRDYVFASNVFMPVLYPAGENTKADAALCAARAVQDMKKVQSDIREAHAVRKSIWPVIRCFNDREPWKFCLTEKELRAVSFASLVTGANGIVWHAYASDGTEKNHGIAETKESWKTLAAVSKEIAGLADVLAAERPDIESSLVIAGGASVNALKEPSIVYEIRKNPKRTLLIAVNTANAAVNAEFTVPGYTKAVPVNGIKAEESKKGFWGSLFKSKETFAVSFEPLGTAIYELKK